MLKKILLLTLCIAFLNARVVVDTNGEKITIPDKVEWASPMVGIFVQIAVSVGGGDKIISGAYNGLSPMMLKVFPNIKMTGFKGGTPGASVETIIASKTQVVFGPAGVLFDDNVKKQLENAGIAVVRMGRLLTNVDDLKERISRVAEIFGDESIEQAKQLHAHIDESIAFVQERLPKNAEKKRVLVIYDRAGNWSTTSTNSIAGEYIRLAGGVNLASQKSASFGSSPSVNEEQIIVYNPDIIITNTQDSVQTILKKESFKYIKAVKDKQIFVQPRGVSTMSSGTEGGLQVLWLAKIFYPNEFKDVDMKAKVREFYKRFYSYDLNEDELSEILYPTKRFKPMF